MGYDKKDAAQDTDTSTSKVSEAWHQSRDDSGVRDAPSGERGNEETATKGNQAEAQAAESKFGLPSTDDQDKE